MWMFSLYGGRILNSFDKDCMTAKPKIFSICPLLKSLLIPGLRNLFISFWLLTFQLTAMYLNFWPLQMILSLSWCSIPSLCYLLPCHSDLILNVVSSIIPCLTSQNWAGRSSHILSESWTSHWDTNCSELNCLFHHLDLPLDPRLPKDRVYIY